MTPIYSKFALNDKQLTAIGCVAVESSFLEHLIEAGIWGLCAFDEPTGRIFTDGKMLDARLDALRDLVKLKITNDDAQKKFKLIFDQIKDVLPKRNTIIHGLWHVPLSAVVSGGIPLSSDAVAIKTKRKTKQKTIHAEEAMSIANEISRLYAELSNFHLRYIPLRALPNKDT